VPANNNHFTSPVCLDRNCICQSLLFRSAVAIERGREAKLNGKHRSATETFCFDNSAAKGTANGNGKKLEHVYLFN